MCISPSTLVDILARALQRGKSYRLYGNKRAGSRRRWRDAPLPSFLSSPSFYVTLERGDGAYLGKGRGLLQSWGRQEEFGHSGDSVSRLMSAAHNFEFILLWFIFFFFPDLGLMCYSWSTSFWLQRLPFNHHTNDVFAEVLLIVKCVYVSSLLVYEERVQVSYLIFPCAIFVRIRALIKDGTKKKCCWCRVSAGVCAGCFVKKKGEKL